MLARSHCKASSNFLICFSPSEMSSFCDFIYFSSFYIEALIFGSSYSLAEASSLDLALSSLRNSMTVRSASSFSSLACSSSFVIWSILSFFRGGCVLLEEKCLAGRFCRPRGPTSECEIHLLGTITGGRLQVLRDRSALKALALARCS